MRQNKPNKLENSLFYIPHQSRKPDVDYDSGASVTETTSSGLPRGFNWQADGVYSPSSHQIKIDKDSPSDYQMYVRAHESAHGLGVHDEYKADCLAAAKTGKAYLIRGPFYQPPLRKAA